MTLVIGSEIAANTIVLREEKGSPLSTAEFDWDLITLMNAINVLLSGGSMEANRVVQTNYLGDLEVAGTTSTELENLTNGANADALHTHSLTTSPLEPNRVIQTNSLGGYEAAPTTSTELETLTDGSNADALHTHAVIASSSYNMTSGQTALVVGTHCINASVEMLHLGSLVGAQTLSMIEGATAGQIKIIVATSNDVTIENDASYIKLKSPIFDDFEMQTGDVLAIGNIGGNPLTSYDGIWFELCRSFAV